MLTFNELIKELKGDNIYMLTGNGSKNQFRYLKSRIHSPYLSGWIFFDWLQYEMLEFE